MAGAFRDHPGGIEGLLTLSGEEWGAIEADLIRGGKTLQDVPSVVSWRAVRNMAENSTYGSAYYHRAGGPEVAWSENTYATVALIEVIQEFIWLWRCSKLKKGQMQPPHPKPIKRPGAADTVDPSEEKVTGEALPATDWAEFWRTGVRPNAAAAAASLN